MTRPSRPSNAEPKGRGGADERRQRLSRGLVAEHVAVALLMLKGYRIIARRLRTPYGELDLIAARGRRLAFVEVKRRLTISDAEAALTPHQAGRIGRAADYWLDRHPAFRNHEIGLDAVLVMPRRWPRHIPNALDGI
ncbi:MAG: YraN family protein [Hyphomicrobiaceae bacterium]